ncbi:hypothetical protein [Melissococcus plutonius]|uniref:hypothetical protein n=1 Tax=Melissococcus plutonius TaxID=33970 RepID=UPI000669C988|nr:hypothetical protein [Melissococcus plutonius]KMT33289.1 hypothetical protein MEPL6_1c03240 [Melissococcus plutonius]KMT33635.1 hypothetical protein MEPL8_7c00730 [Melissococcus plutonius]KMT39002.1 hypothetical protein MEPL12_5c01080 [Melissococcus plutonius]BBD15639.1 prophage pi3 protein 59 [Melissococcus plutonius]
MKKVIYGIFGGLAFCLLLTDCGGEKKADASNNVNNANNVKKVENTKKQLETKKEKNLLSEDKDFGKLTSNAQNGGKVTIENRKDYNTSFSDNNWAGVEVKVDKISVIKTSPMTSYSDDNYSGFVAIHYIINNSQRDISIYPQQAKISTNYGEQIDDDSFSTDSWDGDLMKGTNRDGWGISPLSKLENANQLKNLRISFNANYDTDNVDDDNTHHDYDISLQLQ